MLQQDGVIVIIRVCCSPKETRNTPVRDFRAFGLSGRSRCINNVRYIVRLDQCLKICTTLPFKSFPVSIKAEKGSLGWGTMFLQAAFVKINGTSLSFSINASRSAGALGSNGRYTPPAFNTASIATIISGQRSTKMATGISGPIPCFFR